MGMGACKCDNGYRSQTGGPIGQLASLCGRVEVVAVEVVVQQVAGAGAGCSCVAWCPRHCPQGQQSQAKFRCCRN
eukprot:6491019-Amphidinium_carterae.5